MEYFGDAVFELPKVLMKALEDSITKVFHEAFLVQTI